MDPFLKSSLQYIQKDYIDHIINFLQTGIFNQPSTANILTAYSKVMELADKNTKLYPKILYDIYTKTIAKYLVNTALPKILSKTKQELLWEFMQQWEKHGILTYWMNKIFGYLDRVYLTEYQHLTLSQTGLNLFKKYVFDKLNKEIVTTIFDEIQAEREGEMVDWNKLKKILYCYRMMGISDASVEKDISSGEITWIGNINIHYYKENFEGEFIKQTKDFYKKQADYWMQTHSCPEYVNLAFEALKKEEDKVLNFLDMETRPKLLSALQDVLVLDKAQELCDKEKTGVFDLLREKRFQDLKKLYQLFTIRPKCHMHIYNKLGPYIETAGKTIIEDKETLKDPIQFINRILEFKKEIDQLVHVSFESNINCVQARDRSLANVLNDCSYTPSFLGEHVDMLMTKGLKGKEAFAEQIIDDLFDIFRLIRQKDAFITRYQQLYAYRLLQGTSISQDAEELLISRLKIELGAQYVSKLIQMGVDMRNSRDLTEGFRKKVGMDVKGIELTVKVLTAGLWSEQKNAKCRLPGEINTCCTVFENFYKSDHVGKNIYWVASLGDCELKTVYLPRPYTLITSVYQAAILSFYNKNTVYTFSELKENTGLSDEELLTHLFPLMNPKMGKLLVKENMKTPKCTLSEKITLNATFQSVNLKLMFIPVSHQAKVFFSSFI